ncbi:MAG: 4Fe-4S dicluster domain-containing protein [Candidatus Muiribacteriota bacterium]
MAKKLQVINRGKCTGCRICETTCGQANFSTPFTSAIRVEGSIFNEDVSSLKICLNCEKPPCVEACPTGYLTVKEDKGGGVKINKKYECVKCGNCYNACRYGYLRPLDDKTPLLCRQCGLCAMKCPNNCLIMVDADNE